MKKMKSILNQTSWWPINKEFTRAFGIDVSVYIMDLSGKQEYFSNNNKLDEEGFFFNTKKDIQADTTLSPYQQDKALKVLKDFGFVETKLEGMPAKVHYKVNVERLNEAILYLHNNPEDRKALKG
jgi:hypothetical protein